MFPCATILAAVTAGLADDVAGVVGVPTVAALFVPATMAAALSGATGGTTVPLPLVFAIPATTAAALGPGNAVAVAFTAAGDATGTGASAFPEVFAGAVVGTVVVAAADAD